MSFYGLVAKKVGMSRIMDKEGNFIPVTILSIAKQKVIKICTKEKEGYCAVQIGYCIKHNHNLNKPQLGHLKKYGIKETFAKLKEFRVDDSIIQNIKIGTDLNAELLNKVNNVDITGISKGKGFQGAVKRWSSHKGVMSHGSCYHRRAGSIGCNARPSRVWKNRKMPGHLGNEQVTIKNLKVIYVDTENNIVAIKGSVPGYNNSYLFVKPTTKTNKTLKIIK